MYTLTIIYVLAILKNQEKLTIRAGLVLPPVNFKANQEKLCQLFNSQISEEEAMSYLMYPKVFTDYMHRIHRCSDLLRYLPTPVYLYSMLPGHSFAMHTDIDDCSGVSATLSIELKRIGPLQRRHRSIVFSVNGNTIAVDVKDTSGAFVFEGEMAKASDSHHVASPMPGVIEKLLVKEGDVVDAGAVLCTVSAMKMEVKVTASCAGVIDALLVAVGTRVVEGALLMKTK